MFTSGYFYQTNPITAASAKSEPVATQFFLTARKEPSRNPGDDQRHRVRLNGGSFRYGFANLAIAISDGARPALYGKLLVAAPSINPKVVNRQPARFISGLMYA